MLFKSHIISSWSSGGGGGGGEEEKVEIEIKGAVRVKQQGDNL